MEKDGIWIFLEIILIDTLLLISTQRQVFTHKKHAANKITKEVQFLRALTAFLSFKSPLLRAHGFISDRNRRDTFRHNELQNRNRHRRMVSSLGQRVRVPIACSRVSAFVYHSQRLRQ